MNSLIRLLSKTRLLKGNLTAISFALGYVIPTRGNGHVIMVGQTTSVLFQLMGSHRSIEWVLLAKHLYATISTTLRRSNSEPDPVRTSN